MTRTPIGDPRFFARCGPHSLATVAETACGAAATVDLQLTGVAPLQTAGPDEVSFLDNRRWLLSGSGVMDPGLGSVPQAVCDDVRGAG